MEIRSTEEARENITKYAERYLDLLLQKKAIDKDIKALKEEFKEEGVAVGVVVSVINQIKASKKKTASEHFEEDAISEWLVTNTKIDDKIGELIAKD